MRKNLIFALLWCLWMSPLATMAQEDDGATASESTTKTYTLGSNAGASLVGSGEVYLTYTKKDGQFLLTDKASGDNTINPEEYSGIRVDCTNPNNVKVKIDYTETGNTQYLEVNEGSNTYEFKNDCGNIKQITIYANEEQDADENGNIASVTVNEVYLQKRSSEETITLPENPSNSWGYNVSSEDNEGNTSFSLTFSQAWGQYAFIDEGEIDINEYSGFRICTGTDFENVQLKVVYTDLKEDGSNIETNPQLESSGETSCTFATDCGNVLYVAVQSTSSWTGDDSPLTISAAYLTKAPSEEEAVYPGTETYNCTPTYASDVTAVKFNSQWNAVYLMDGEDYATFKQGEGKTVYYTITFAEPIPSTLYYELDYLDDDSQFKSLNGGEIAKGSTSYTFSISDDVVNQSVDGIKIEANAENTDVYPFIVKFASVYSTEDYAEATFNLGTLGTASFNSTYDPTTRTITYSGQYGGCGWWFGGHDLSVYQGVEVAFKTETTDYIQLVVEYLNENGTKTDTLSVSANTTGWGNMTDGRTLYVDFNGDFAKNVLQIYIQNGTTEDAQIKVVGARLLEKAVEGEPYTYEMNLAGYALTNWADEDGDSGTIEVDDETGTAHLSFTKDEFGGLGWKNWSEAVTNVGKWNLAQFDHVEITYEVEGGEWSEDEYLELFVQLNKYSDEGGELVDITAKNASEESGKFSLPVSSGTFTDADGNDVEGGEIDWTGCGQLVILASKADMEVTVTSIKFIRDKRDVDTEDHTYDLSTEDAVMPKVGYSGVELHVKGDGTTNHHTITFPLNSSGTYNIYLEDVTIDTSSDGSGLISGLTIPRGVTVNLITLGDSTIATSSNTELEKKTSIIKGSTYGIRAGLGSYLQFIMDRGATLNIGATDEDDENPSGYGLYFLGNSLTSDNFTTLGNDMAIGQLNITGKWCGIYIGEETSECDIKCINMTVIATGDSGVDVPDDMPTYYTGRTKYEAPHDGIDMDAYLESDDTEHYVCGIYIKAKYTVFDLSGGNFVITAAGEKTYGTFSLIENGYSFWFMYGTYVITATECVIHHTTDANRWCGYVGFQGETTLISLNGPFCSHFEYWDGGYSEWYCDSSEGTSYIHSNQNVTFIIDDNYSTINRYTFNDEQEFGTVVYVNRNLYAGWNTLCLPYCYDLSRSDDEYESSNDPDLFQPMYQECAYHKEARDIISKYGDFGSATQTTDDEGNNVIEFTSYSTLPDDSEEAESGDIFLVPDRAYLVYVPEDTEGLDSEGAIKVKFTSKYDDNWQGHGAAGKNGDNLVHLRKVSNTQGEHDTGETYAAEYGLELSTQPLVTVFCPEPMTTSSATEDSLYKIGGSFTQTISEEGDTVNVAENWFNRPTETGITIADYRALIDASDYSISSASLNIKAIDGNADDNSTTGIQLVENVAVTSPGDVYVYSVNGQLVKIVPAGGNVVTGLAKGVYIVDGKKVAVK